MKEIQTHAKRLKEEFPKLNLEGVLHALEEMNKEVEKLSKS